MNVHCRFFRLRLLTVCQEVPVDNIVLAPQLLGQLTSLVYLALQQTKEEKCHSCYDFDHVATRYPRTMQTEVRPSLICGPRPIGQKSPEERERHQFSVQSTPDRLIHPPPNFLRFSSRKRRHLGQNHQRSCSAEHALHYNNCRLNVSETNAVHKTCFKSTILRSKRFREGKAFKMSNDRKRRLDVDGSGSGSKKHR